MTVTPPTIETLKTLLFAIIWLVTFSSINLFTLVLWHYKCVNEIV